MAMLIPLLLPHIVAASANIGLGLSNAFQGDSSSVSLQIGNKVFTSKKSCNLDTLPAELRIKIILMALEESKDLILPIPPFLNPTEPIMRQDLRELESHSPFNPESDHYGSIRGDTVEANGYPRSAWRWSLVSREWRDVLKEPLWTHLEVKGYHRYSTLLRLIDGDDVSALSRVKRLTLREGFRSPEEIYTILSAPLPNVTQVSIMPDYPTSFHQLVFAIPAFPFGLQLVRTTKPMTSLTYGLPLESTTNSASRQHLKQIRAPRLSLTFVIPTAPILSELTDLAEVTTHLTIRYIPLRGFVDASLFMCQALQSFQNIELRLLLPRPRMIMVGSGENRTIVEDPESPGRRFITNIINTLELADEDTRGRYTILLVDGWDVPGRVRKAKETKLWPKEALWDLEAETQDFKGSSGSAESTAGPSIMPTKNKAKPDHWERETNLRLLGGLFNLRLESKKK